MRVNSWYASMQASSAEKETERVDWIRNHWKTAVGAVIIIFGACLVFYFV
jgi:hypothetical protein